MSSISRPGLLAACVLALLVPAAARAASPGEPLTAVRAHGPIRVDGRLDDGEWHRAVPFDGFAQHFPTEGAPPSHPTEVLVLHDDRTLYVGVRCRDATPGAIVRSLGRRDDAPSSDHVLVAVDSMHDRRMAYVFTLTAAGVQEDGILFEDDRLSKEWDAVWEGAAATSDAGWEAELAIPLAALRFSNAPVQTWGIGVKRVIQRHREELLSFRQPRAARGSVRYLNALVGLTDLVATRELALQPYTAARVAVRPEDEDAPRLGRVADPIADLGLDLRAGIGRGLTLQGTLNPDFGQVEADQILQNLSTYELFFPEKRPFFTEGMDLFQPVAPANRQAPFQLFYSRRIGLDGPILGAAKLTGKAGRSLDVGLVEAVVTGDGFAGGDGGRRFRFAPAQPLHFGPARALPEHAPARRNFVAGVARWKESPTRTFGAMVTSALPLESGCTQAELDAADAADEDPPARCETRLGNAAGVDWNVRSANGEWFLLGQAAASQYLGGEPRRVLADGTALERGDLGYGGYVAAGRHAGEPWRFEAHYEHTSPRLELNTVGFQRTQNEQVARGIVRYARPSGGGPFHSWILFGGTEGRWTTDDRTLLRAKQVWGGFEAQLRSYHWLGCTGWWNGEDWDVREITESGVALRTPADVGGECWIATDAGRPVWGEAGLAYGRTWAKGPLPVSTGWVASTAVVVRPHPRFESRVELRYGDDTLVSRHLDDRALDDPATPAVEPGREYLFADLHAPAASILLREAFVITPRLTLQAYGQLFVSYGEYGIDGRYYVARPGARGRIAPADLVPGFETWRLDPSDAAPPSRETLRAEYDFRDVALNLNVVLRWEYRLGSTLFLVYTRAQAEPDRDGAPPLAIAPRSLSRGPATDTFLVKWTYFWSR